MGDVKKHLERLALSQFKDAQSILSSFCMDTSVLAQVAEAGVCLSKALGHNNKVLVCGNGGSMCDADHFVEELTGRFRKDRPPLPAIAISHPSHITCVGNDYGFAHIFSRYVRGIGQKGDVLVALSTSGRSQNVLNALEEARRKGMYTIALAGAKAMQADICLCVPWQHNSDRIQEIHMMILHILVYLVEEQLFNEHV